MYITNRAKQDILNKVNLHLSDRKKAFAQYEHALANPNTSENDLIINYPDIACMYAQNVIKGRWKEAEHIIMKDPEWACIYALDVIEGRWEDAEPYIMTNPEHAFDYAISVIEDVWPEAEPYIMTNPEWAYYYAYEFMDNRWHAAEIYIKGTEWQEQYEDNFDCTL